MYAVIETGGKQYRVQQGDIIDVEIFADADAEKVSFDKVLLVGDGDNLTIGQPVVEGASVAGELLANVRAPKITVFKKKRRKGYKRTQGHRQNLQRVRIGAISA